MPFLTPFLVGRVRDPTKIDRNKGTLIPTSLLEDLVQEGVPKMVGLLSKLLVRLETPTKR